MKRQNSLRHIMAAVLSLSVIMVTVFSLSGPAHAEEAVPDNGIPVVYINIDESEGTIEDMIASPDHSVLCYGTLSIEVPEGFHYSDYPDLDLKNYEDLKMSIRGRGNSTWNQDKKPFKIKLEKKENIFGFGKNKHWALLANAMDPSLIRNRVTYHLSETLDFDFTPQGVPVDLVMRGDQYGSKYLGSYYLCETVRIDDNRLEIDELEESDTEMPAISGGYLIQNALQIPEGSLNRFNTVRGEAWAVDTPSFDTLDGGYENKAQKNYIVNHLNTVEDALYEGGEEYRKLMDVKSAAGYWLINTLAKNLDAYKTSSTYIYKKRDTEEAAGKVYWGPVWDFDYAWDEGETYEGMSAGGHLWMKPLFTDRSAGGFIEEVKKQWPELKKNAESIIAKGGLIDQYYEETQRSAEKDHEINPGKEGSEETYSYKEKVEKLKTWIQNRIEWLDANIASIDELVHTAAYMVGDEVIAKDYFETGETIMVRPYEPEKEGYVFMGWEDQDGSPVEYEITGDHDLILTAKFIPESEAVQAADIVFVKNSDIVRFDPENPVYLVDWCVLPYDAYNKTVVWSLSDESIASIDDAGQVTIHKPGTVSITATLHNGIQKDFILTITEEKLTLPEAILPEEEVIHMNVGETAYTPIRPEPALSKVDEYYYESEDEEIASVDSYGIIRAYAEGTVRIHVQSNTYTRADPYTLEAWITVIISEAAQSAEYTVVSGADVKWQKGSKEGITFTVKRSEADETCLSHFLSAEIDGTDLIRDTDYTAKAGSTVISVSPVCLEKLNAGAHTLTVTFDDGEAETGFTIENDDAGTAPVPNTGDHTSSGLWAGLIAVSLLVFFAAVKQRSRI